MSVGQHITAWLCDIGARRSRMEGYRKFRFVISVTTKPPGQAKEVYFKQTSGCRQKCLCWK